jgi:hypothetical protein
MQETVSSACFLLARCVLQRTVTNGVSSQNVSLWRVTFCDFRWDCVFGGFSESLDTRARGNFSGEFLATLLRCNMPIHAVSAAEAIERRLSGLGCSESSCSHAARPSSTRSALYRAAERLKRPQRAQISHCAYRNCATAVSF